MFLDEHRQFVDLGNEPKSTTSTAAASSSAGIGSTESRTCSDTCSSIECGL